MSTDNISPIPTREELMQSVVLDYAPFYSVFKGVPHEAKIENVKFTTIRGDDEIVAKGINAQDTERAHVKSGVSSKYYAKAFKGVQYAESIRQAQSALPNINNKILKAFHKQLDAEIWNGVDNNGVIVSSDPNHISNSASTLPLSISGNNGIDKLVALFNSLKTQVENTSSSSNYEFAVYGADLKAYLLKILSNGSTYKKVLQDAFSGIKLLDVPANLSASANGIVVICPDIVDLHYTLLPQIENTGTDQRNSEAWVNYIYGTAMVDVKERGGLIVQPVSISD